MHSRALRATQATELCFSLPTGSRKIPAPDENLYHEGHYDRAVCRSRRTWRSYATVGRPSDDAPISDTSPKEQRGG